MVEMADVDEITAAARRVRRALEGDGWASYGLREVPRGACGDASRLLGLHLESLGWGKWTYVMGIAPGPDGGTHAWLEQAGLVVDITADQFPDIDEAVIVTTDRTWHERRFPPARSSSMDLTPDDSLWPDYRRLTADLTAGER
jgi:hypothetical protein